MELIGDFQPDYVLQANDIFYVDLDVVWDGHEGDAGDTFVVGDDPEMAACAEAARTLWHEVAARWRDEGLSGPALYDFGFGLACFFWSFLPRTNNSRLGFSGN